MYTNGNARDVHISHQSAVHDLQFSDLRNVDEASKFDPDSDDLVYVGRRLVCHETKILAGKTVAGCARRHDWRVI